MEGDSNDDINSYKQSQKLITNIKTDVGELEDWETLANRRRRARLVATIDQGLDDFQQDPQLFDPHLSFIATPLVTLLLLQLRSDAFKARESEAIEKVNALSTLLCTLCKVRGRKVVARFLNNEPRHLEPLLDAHDTLTSLQPPQVTCAGDASSDSNDKLSKGDGNVASWQSVHVILLWLWQLVLTPFELASLSGNDLSIAPVHDLEIPIRMPDVAKRLLKAGLESLLSATNQRAVAANLLVRLCLRPDMRLLGVLKTTISWALTRLKSEHDDPVVVHHNIGLLSLLAGIVRAGSLGEVGSSMISIYDTVVTLFRSVEPAAAPLLNSAVAKCLAIKIQRNILIQLLVAKDALDAESAATVNSMLDTRSTLEDVIEHLLGSLADRDTTVRLAASKALSVLAQKLNQNLADEIADAIIGSLNEDVFESDGVKNYIAVNPQRWHGLTMTLAHLLFRRIPSAVKLLEILDALYLALVFECRSSSGYSIGGNVRDAANFGLWSLARRYSTKELSIGASNSTLQNTALHLVCAACLDPVGNVRRGASAALQELVGRHPDTIEEGIPLIQIVDYQAVGLRSRAVEHVAVKAAKLSPAYRVSLRDAMLGWRGLRAPDEHPRESAAKTFFWLVKLDRRFLEEMIRRIHEAPAREVEVRHGLLMALAEIVRYASSSRPYDDEDAPRTSEAVGNELIFFGDRFDELLTRLASDPAQLRPPTRRPELIGRGIIFFIASYTEFRSHLKTHQGRTDATSDHNEENVTNLQNALDLLTAALQVVREDDTKWVRSLVNTVALCSTRQSMNMAKLARNWLQIMKKSSVLSRIPAVLIALGTLCGNALPQVVDGNRDLQEVQTNAIEALVSNARTHQDIDVRVIAIRSLSYIFDFGWPVLLPNIIDTFHEGLNDYTNTERGDVGSLVRIEALRAIRRFWSKHHNHEQAPAEAWRCYTSTLELALGKLDRVRVEAVRTLQAPFSFCGWRYPQDPSRPIDALLVSEAPHFRLMGDLLRSPSTLSAIERISSQELAEQELLAVLEGFAISAGSGTSATLPAARQTIAEAFEEPFPINGHDPSIHNARNLVDIANALSTLLSGTLADDRVNIPLLELTAFLLDYNILQRLSNHDSVSSIHFSFRRLLSLVQKSHFKSTSMPKLLAAVNVYSGLLDVAEVRNDVLAKLIGMLLHPFPRVRDEAAKVLWMAVSDEELKSRVWSDAPAEHKAFVAKLKSRHVRT